jgi:ABC-2 type transport system permease protein
MTTTGEVLRVNRSWRIWRIVPLIEIAFRIRFFMAPFMIAVQMFLYYRLWTAVFAHTPTAAGLNAHQTITYSMLALLAGRLRWNARTWSRDDVATHVRDGTIIYWFLRPISPNCYYLYRTLGDLAYGVSWSALGFVAAFASGLIRPPASPTIGAMVVLCLALGQVTLYYFGQIVDLCTFWMVNNLTLVRMYYFLQDLLAGVFVPLWFMPGWLLTTTSILPFSAAINIPISLYVGRIGPSQVAGPVLLECVWILILAALTRYFWSRASLRVASQGG